jgi:hypothetical protein
LTRSFSYSALRTYMHIPTKKLLTRDMLHADDTFFSPERQ